MRSARTITPSSGLLNPLVLQQLSLNAKTPAEGAAHKLMGHTALLGV